MPTVNQNTYLTRQGVDSSAIIEKRHSVARNSRKNNLGSNLHEMTKHQNKALGRLNGHIDYLNERGWNLPHFISSTVVDYNSLKRAFKRLSDEQVSQVIEKTIHLFNKILINGYENTEKEMLEFTRQNGMDKKLALFFTHTLSLYDQYRSKADVLLAQEQRKIESSTKPTEYTPLLANH